MTILFSYGRFQLGTNFENCRKQATEFFQDFKEKQRKKICFSVMNNRYLSLQMEILQQICIAHE